MANFGISVTLFPVNIRHFLCLNYVKRTIWPICTNLAFLNKFWWFPVHLIQNYNRVLTENIEISNLIGHSVKLRKEMEFDWPRATSCSYDSVFKPQLVINYRTGNMYFKNLVVLFISCSFASSYSFNKGDKYWEGSLKTQGNEVLLYY